MTKINKLNSVSLLTQCIDSLDETYLSSPTKYIHSKLKFMSSVLEANRYYIAVQEADTLDMRKKFDSAGLKKLKLSDKVQKAIDISTIREQENTDTYKMYLYRLARSIRYMNDISLDYLVSNKIIHLTYKEYTTLQSILRRTSLEDKYMKFKKNNIVITKLNTEQENFRTLLVDCPTRRLFNIFERGDLNISKTSFFELLQYMEVYDAKIRAKADREEIVIHGITIINRNELIEGCIKDFAEGRPFKAKVNLPEDLKTCDTVTITPDELTMILMTF